jgi:pyridoxamine 5'-phosphate oxidase
MTDVSNVRREYNLAKLDIDQLDSNPITQFEAWLQQAVDAKLKDPTAMTVATVNRDGQPSQRIVLLKTVDQSGFVFFTNMGSRKATDIRHNNKVSLHFPWHMMERQVKVCGTASQISFSEVASYFASRPKDSQIAALISAQSQPISTRQVLMGKFLEAKEKFKQGKVPVPDLWGGFRVVPHEIEFWQGGEHRLHDRFQYQLQNDDSWKIQRLMP